MVFRHSNSSGWKKLRKAKLTEIALTNEDLALRNVECRATEYAHSPEETLQGAEPSAQITRIPDTILLRRAQTFL